MKIHIMYFVGLLDGLVDIEFLQREKIELIGEPD